MRVALVLCLMVLLAAGAVSVDAKEAVLSDLRSFLIAVRDLNGDKIWQFMSSKTHEDLEKEYQDAKRTGEIKDLIEEMGDPRLNDCANARQFLVIVCDYLKQSFPDEVSALKETLSDSNLNVMLDQAEVKIKGNKASVALEGSDDLKMVFQNGRWLIDQVEGLNILDF